jgi:hypothetical protein
MVTIWFLALSALEEVARQLHALGRTMILCGAARAASAAYRAGGISRGNPTGETCDNVEEALRRPEEVFERINAKATVAGK